MCPDLCKKFFFIPFGVTLGNCLSYVFLRTTDMREVRVEKRDSEVKYIKKSYLFYPSGESHSLHWPI